MEKHKIYYQSLYNSIDNPAFSPHIVILTPNQNEGNLIKHPGQEFLYVLKDQLTFQIINDTHVLNSADPLMFDSSHKHYWYNYTDKNIKFLCVNYDDVIKSQT